jgi:hypothetical protein
MQHIDVDTAKTPELRAALKTSISECERLRDSVSRLMRHPSASRSSLTTHPDDTVTADWLGRHGIRVPRADGVHDSPEAWVRIKNGVIVGAGLKNQSILTLMISLELLDEGAERHGNLYKDWRAAFLSRVDPSKSGDKGSDGFEAWTKEDRYSKLVHAVEKDYISAMDCIVAGRPKARHLAAFEAEKGAFANIFKVVARAMAVIEKDAEDANGRK